MTIDGKTLAKACGGKDLDVATHLCRAQLNEFERQAKDNSKLLIACTQEAPLFLETTEEMGDSAPELRFTNIRERAGWTGDADAKKANPAVTAKMAALLAEASLDVPAAPSVSLVSGGVLLVIGKGQEALDAARQVSHRLDVTVILTGDTMTPPGFMDIPIFRGRITGSQGHIGAFQVEIEDFTPASPSSRAEIAFEGAGQSGTSVCDLILDLRGDTALFTAPDKRDGYFNPDPGNPTLVSQALLELTDLVGEFEKPRYIDYDASICAHSRAGITGCTRCLDACPTGAITPDGDHVNYDPYICAGCGTCASICPTGAAKYALPAGDVLYERLRTLLGTFLKAGGENPQLLVHDGDWGDEMIGIMARAGGGLPAGVLPFAVNSATQVGLEFLLTAAAHGAQRVVIALPPGKAEEKDTLAGETNLAETVLDGLGYGAGRIEIVEETDPEALEKRLRGLAPLPGMPSGGFIAMGRKRSVLSLALNALHENAPKPVDTIELPAGAPFGAVEVNTDGCTICLSCVGACPTGAFKDNEEMPQLSFAEEACVQCGLCRNTCPESVITLVPRLSFLEAARSHQVIKQEEPFECISCGKPFGAKSTIETMIGQLEGHSMFTDEGALDRLRMCDDCRIIDMAEQDAHPMAIGSRPKVRTTDDYLREREELRQQAANDMQDKGLEPEDDS